MWTKTVRRAKEVAALAPLLGAALLVPPPVSALDVAGVTFAERREAEGRTLSLVGAGLQRWKVFVKAYAAALYAEPGVTEADLLGDAPKRLEIEYFWSIPASALRRVTRDRIEKGVDAEAFAALAPEIDALSALYEDIEAGDRLSITYVPGRGTELARNGEPRGVVGGPAFARALFGVWLGDVPVDEKLRDRLLKEVQ